MFVWVIFVLALSTGAHAQNCKADFAEKLVKLGSTFLDVKEITKALTCIEGEFYDEKSMEEISKKGVGCVMGCLNSPFKGITALSIKGNVDKCLKPTPSKDTLGLVEKMMPPILKNIKKISDELFATIKKPKSNGKPKDFCLQKGYCFLKAAITKNFIDNTCKKVVKNKMNQAELNCVVQDAKKLVDINQYSCSKLKL